MRLFYPTPTTFPERKRKLRQCPEKLPTIGKISLFFLFSSPFNHSSLCMCMHKYTVGESCLLSLSHGRPHARTNAHTLSAVWAGFSVLVSPINTATRTLSTPSLANSLSLSLSLRYSHTQTHAQSRTHPCHTHAQPLRTPACHVFQAGTCAPSPCASRCVRD